MNKITNLQEKIKATNLQKTIKEAVTVNRLPKLVCLLLATLIWLLVEFVYVREGADVYWDIDRARLSIPE